MTDLLCSSFLDLVAIELARMTRTSQIRRSDTGGRGARGTQDRASTTTQEAGLALVDVLTAPEQQKGTLNVGGFSLEVNLGGPREAAQQATIVEEVRETLRFMAKEQLSHAFGRDEAEDMLEQLSLENKLFVEKDEEVVLWSFDWFSRALVPVLRSQTSMSRGERQQVIREARVLESLPVKLDSLLAALHTTSYLCRIDRSMVK